MRARLPMPRRRALLAGAGLGLLLVLLAGPVAHADVWANVGPASPLGIGGLDGRWPLSNYKLDEHFTAISVGVFSGVDVSGLLPMIAYFFADLAWQGTAWLANTLIDLFGFAFSLDLLNGSQATGGAGALGPVARAIHSIYATVFGGPWMVAAISVAGLWAMWRALIQRRYAETAGRLALSLAYVAVALLFVWQPAQTIGRASELTNSMSGAFLSIAKDGEPGSQEEAKQAGADQLFGLLVAQPWAVLEFGGLEHCVRAGGGEEPESVAVQPLPAEAAHRLESGEEVSTSGKTCINNLKKYGAHFLRFGPESEERDEEFEALQKGDASKLPEADPSKAKGDYKLGPADEPAATAMEKGGQYERLLVALLVFVCELGAFCLLGALSVGVILAQVLLLLFLAFSPVALVAAVIPGRGHDFFMGWLQRLASLLLRKAAYSLLLAILLAVCAAISSATSELGWFFSFGLQCAFFWAVFLQRRSLTEGFLGIVTGPSSPGRDRTLDLLALYYGGRSAGRAAGTAARTPFRAAGAGVRGTRRVAHGVARLRGRGGGAPREGVAPLRVRGVPLGGIRYHKDLRHGPKPGAEDQEKRGGPSEPTARDRRRARSSEGARTGSSKAGGGSGERSSAGTDEGPGGPGGAGKASDRGRAAAGPGPARPGPEKAGADDGPAGEERARRGARRSRQGSRRGEQAAPAPKAVRNPRTPGQAPAERPAAKPGRPAPGRPAREEKAGLAEELRSERERARAEAPPTRPAARPGRKTPPRDGARAQARPAPRRKGTRQGRKGPRGGRQGGRR
ncbi:MAG: hypothetical protein QM729_07005 [Solirubrobacterales bacterium]